MQRIKSAIKTPSAQRSRFRNFLRGTVKLYKPAAVSSNDHSLPKELRAMEEANARWQHLLKVDSSSELALSNLTSNYLSEKNIHSANLTLAQYQSLPAISKMDRLCELQARFYGVSGKHTVAIEHWEKALAHGADVLRCKNAILNHALSARNLELAKKMVAEMDVDHGSDEDFRIAKARLHIYSLDWTAAIQILENTDSFVKRRSLAVDLLYRCYMNDYRHESALALCEALDKDKHPQQQFMLGKVKYRLNDYRTAIDMFASKITNDEHIESRVWLIKSLYAANEMNSAVAQAELTSKLSGIDALTCAKCWEAAGKLTLANDYYNRAVKANPSAEALQALVNFLFRYRMFGEAYAVIVRYKDEVKDIPEIEQIFQTIVAACSVTNTFMPETASELDNFKFRSSEEMVTAIVNKILEKNVGQTLSGRNTTVGLKKVVLLINSLGPGGAERQVVNLANGVAEKGNAEMVLLCTYLSRLEQDCFYLKDVTRDVRVGEYYDRNVHLDVTDIPELAEYAGYLEHIQPISRQQLILHMAKKLLEEAPDVVHGWLDETFINTALVCRMLGIDCVVGRWGSMPPGVGRTTTERDQNNIEYLQHAYQQIARLPDLNYCSNSRLTGNAYADLLGIEQKDVSIIYNGIDIKKLEKDSLDASSLKRDIDIPKDCQVVGTVIRISDEKRPKLWVDIARAFLVTHPHVHFVMVGAGPLAGQIQEYARSIGCTNVHFVGKQTNVGAWLKMFDLFLLTSRVEGVSNAVIEAQFCSCPVVAPNVGGLGEAIKHKQTGLLLEDHSVESFVSAVTELLEDPDLVMRYSKSAREFSEERFSMSSMVDGYEKIFDIQ